MVRIKTTEVLHIMATHNVGRWAAVSGNECQALEPHPALGGMPLNDPERSVLCCLLHSSLAGLLFSQNRPPEWFWLPRGGPMEPSVLDQFFC